MHKNILCRVGSYEEQIRITADGQRFLTNSFMEDRGATPINIVKNWIALTKR